MSTRAILIGGALVLIALATLSSTFYTVSETEQVVITQFGEPIGKSITKPGLHVKVPFAQDVNVFDKRWLEWNGNPNQVPTRDKKYIWVETYARWRIANPLLFFQRLRDERGAQSRLDDIIDGDTRNVIANHDLIEVVRVSNRAFEQGGGRPRTSWRPRRCARSSLAGQDHAAHPRAGVQRHARLRHRAGRHPDPAGKLHRNRAGEGVRADDLGAQAHRRPLPFGRPGQERRDPRQEGAGAQGDRVRGLPQDPGDHGAGRRRGGWRSTPPPTTAIASYTGSCAPWRPTAPPSTSRRWLMLSTGADLFHYLQSPSGSAPGRASSR